MSLKTKNTNFDRAVEKELYNTARLLSRKGARPYNRIKFNIIAYGYRAIRRVEWLGYKKLVAKEKTKILFLIAERFPDAALRLLNKEKAKNFLSEYKIARAAILNHKKTSHNDIASLDLNVETTAPSSRVSLGLLALNKIAVHSFEARLPGAISFVNAEIGAYKSQYEGIPLRSDLVSIIVPVRNVENYIDRCLCSLLKQSHSNIEIIIIDDSSTDKTLDRIYQYEDERIKLIKHEVQSGPYTARNNGLNQARGKFFTFLDGDDYVHPDRISIHLHEFYSKPIGTVGTLSQWFRIDSEGHICDRKVWPLVRLNVGSLFVLREKVLTEVGYFHEVMHGADNEYMARINRFFGDQCLSMIRIPLTYAARRSDSLTASREYGYSSAYDHADRRCYWESWSAWHEKNAGSVRYLKHSPREAIPFEIPSKMKVNNQGRAN